MAANVRFDEKVTVGLRLDEAIVLLGYLSRETWGRGSSRLERTFDHPAESHGVQDLLQQSFAQLVYVGTERMQGMDDAARDSLLQRYSDDEGDLLVASRGTGVEAPYRSNITHDLRGLARILTLRRGR